MIFDIAMGTRREDGPLRERLGDALKRNAATIDRILDDYGACRGWILRARSRPVTGRDATWDGVEGYGRGPVTYRPTRRPPCDTDTAGSAKGRPVVLASEGSLVINPTRQPMKPARSVRPSA